MNKAKQVIDELSLMCNEAKKLAADEIFMECLDAEINEYWSKHKVDEAYVSFRFIDQGNLIFGSITENNKEDLSIKIISPAVLKKLEEERAHLKEAERLRKIEEAKKSTEESLAELTRMELDSKRLQLLDKLLGKTNENIS